MGLGSGSIPQKRRHKSFAGCWTCRARKVKCDETRPCCLQCRLKDLECEGYEVRLRWMPLEAGSFVGADEDFDKDQWQDRDPSDTPLHRSQRSLIACGKEFPRSYSCRIPGFCSLGYRVLRIVMLITYDRRGCPPRPLALRP